MHEDGAEAFTLGVHRVGVSAVLCTAALDNELPEVSVLLAVSFSHARRLWRPRDAQIQSYSYNYSQKPGHPHVGSEACVQSCAR